MAAPVHAEEVSAQAADTLLDTVEFSVTGSNVCTHETGDYHLRYDPEQGQMIFEESDDFSPNGTQKHDYQADSQVKTYFELDRALRLEHDRPWVMEYTVTDPGKFVFAEVDSVGTTHPYFLNDDRNYLFVPIVQEFASGEYQTGCYGIDLRGKFTYNTTDSYTLKLENVIDGDESNMIYLTVYNNTIQETVLQSEAMDDYYLIVDSSYVLQDSESKALAGRDFVIRYICNKSYHFDSPSLEMKIWENGVDGGSSDYFTEKLTKPTCASEGYTTYTCSLCGYSYDGNFVETLDHQFGEWTESRESSCSAAGEEQRVCAACGHTETRETVFTEHNYVSEVVLSTCCEQGYTLHTCGVCGHSYTDTFVETTAHALGDWVTTLEATCAAEGEKRRNCENCDYFETAKIEKTAHTYEAVVTAPTCTVKGYTTHICSCGDSYVDSYVDAGHRVVTLPAKTPTATENGLTEGEGCSGCGEVYIAQQVIPAIGSALPEGYQQVKYLESLKGAYIDTGLAALPGDKLILYSTATSNATMSMMGSGSSNTSNDRVQAHHVLYRGYTLRFFGQLCDYVTIPMGQMTTFLFDLEKGMGYIDGKLVLEQQPEVLPTDDNIYLFVKNANGKADLEFAGSCRIYGYKHYRNGALVRDMIPCCRESDGVYGLYDLVNGKFYTKSGEGSLAYEPLELIGEAGIVMNMDTGEVYYSKNLNWKNAMASLMKIMTCVVVLENADLNSRTVPAIRSDLLEGSSMGLTEWESLTVQDALYGLMVPSGCDAAQLLARTVAGDYDSFVDMMNAKAKELGMKDTVFSCASGLDDKKQYSTVADMVKLMRYAMENEVFRKLVSTKNYQIKADTMGAKDHFLSTTNDLLGVYAGCIGGKTGTTTASGAHVIEVVSRHGSTLLAMICSSDPAERYTDVIKLLDYGLTKTAGHVYEPVVTDPTCTEQGYTTYVCQCGESYVDTYVPATGHPLRQWIVEEEPNCTETGSERRECSKCSYFEVREIAAVGHKYNKVVTSPTCTEEGYTTHTCHCGDSYVDSRVEALDHVWNAGVITKEPTEEETGLCLQTCARCAGTRTVILPTTDHVHDYHTAVTDPACTEQGYTTYTCECGHSYAGDFVDALGHDLVFCPERKPTCEQDGWEAYEECNRCDYTTYWLILAEGHQYSSTVVPPSCTEDGYTLRECTVCGFNSVIDYVDALGHEEVILESVAPTCSTSGLTEGSYCATCHEILVPQQTLNALGHTYKSSVKAPTCTEQGYTAYVCQCGEISHVDSYTDPLGHHLWERTLLTAPVSGQECQLRCDCVRCDYYEIRTVEHLVKLLGDDLTKQKEVWINGVPCPVIAAGQDRYVELPSAGEYLLVTYTYQNADNPDIHTQYPTGMKVYKVSGGKITHIKELDDLLRYSGSSIRIKGAKGVRMITSLAKQSKAALTGNGLAGYKLVEYGTTLCWASEIKEGDALTLDKSFARSNYAYKRGVADPIFATTDDLVQYTNVLVGFNNDQCKDDIAMRPYIILEDANGEQITLYGGIVYRSIGYIAYQNRNVVRQGTEAYKYVWEIIHHVYGSKYDADYKD